MTDTIVYVVRIFRTRGRVGGFWIAFADAFDAAFDFADDQDAQGCKITCAGFCEC